MDLENFYEYKAVMILNNLNNSTYLKNLNRIRFYGCKKCKNCKMVDCGICIACKDKPRFGGLGIRKQACKYKPRCLNISKTIN